MEFRFLVFFEFSENSVVHQTFGWTEEDSSKNTLGMMVLAKNYFASDFRSCGFISVFVLFAVAPHSSIVSLTIMCIIIMACIGMKSEVSWGLSETVNEFIISVVY